MEAVSVVNKKEKFFFKSKEQVLYQLFLFALLALTWMNIFDDMAYESNASTLRETIASFLGLKSIVSMSAVLVDSAASVKVFGTGIDIAIGKILEPMKNFAQTASDVMLLSMMSLTLQKFFLAIMQSQAVKILITFNVLLLSINHFIPVIGKRIAVWSFKFLIILWFLRFVIPVIEVVNHQISNQVITLQTRAIAAKEQDLQNRLEKLQVEMLGSDNEQEQRSKKIETLKKEIKNAEKTLDIKENKIDRIIENSKGTRKFIFGEKKLLPTEKMEIQRIKNEIKSLEFDIGVKKQAISMLEDKESTIIDKAIFKIKSLQQSIMVQLGIMVDEWTNMIMLFLLRAVIFPLLFLWMLYKILERLFKLSFAEKMEGAFKDRFSASVSAEGKQHG